MISDLYLSEIPERLRLAEGIGNLANMDGDMCRNDDHLRDWGIHLMGHKKYKFPATGRETGRLGRDLGPSFDSVFRG